MNYSVKELREKLEEKILGLGIDPKFKENPAFAAALEEIERLIIQMNMLGADKDVAVREEKGIITFKWISDAGERYSMSIYSTDPQTFRCIEIEERKPFVDANGKTIKEKTAVEKIATISNSGFITLTTNGALINNIDCVAEKCNNSTWAEKKYYTANGVMREREYKGFTCGELNEEFDKAQVDSMLFIPRRAFNISFFNDKYERRTLLIREMLDTARIIDENKEKGIIYNATIPLNQEYGLRDMVSLYNNYDPYPQTVLIPLLSEEQIDAMIQRESDPKIAEGLRAYAVGRENYFYNSADDENFVRKGITESQGMPR